MTIIDVTACSAVSAVSDTKVSAYYVNVRRRRNTARRAREQRCIDCVQNSKRATPNSFFPIDHQIIRSSDHQIINAYAYSRTHAYHCVCARAYRAYMTSDIRARGGKRKKLVDTAARAHEALARETIVVAREDGCEDVSNALSVVRRDIVSDSLCNCFVVSALKHDQRAGYSCIYTQPICARAYKCACIRARFSMCRPLRA